MNAKFSSFLIHALIFKKKYTNSFVHGSPYEALVPIEVVILINLQLWSFLKNEYYWILKLEKMQEKHPTPPLSPPKKNRQK